MIQADARILIVDDVEDNRAILVRRLQRLGYRHLAEAADGVEALAAVRADPPDLVLLDVMMPRMNGVEVLEAIRAEGRLEETAVIMISAASETDTVVRCLDLGAEDYLPKPFNPSILRARIGSVLEKKALRAEVRRQLQRLEGEMARARRQQLAMVATDFPGPGGLVDLHAVMRPALEVGGDLYDFFAVDAGTLCIAIGDVSGKGMPAALFMARTRSLLRAGTLQHRAITGRTPLPSELAALLNAELCKNNDDSLFVTLLAGFLDLATGRFAFVNAGHLPPILFDGVDATEVPAVADPPLGVVEDGVYADQSLTIGPGEGMLLVTDGLPEMESASRSMFGMHRLVAELRAVIAADSRVIVDHLVAAVFAHAEGAAPFDDVTVLALRRPETGGGSGG